MKTFIIILKATFTLTVFLYGLSLGWRLGEKYNQCVTTTDIDHSSVHSSNFFESVPHGIPCEEETESEASKIMFSRSPVKRVEMDTCGLSNIKEERTHLHLWNGDIAKGVFHNLHNPASPAKWQFIISADKKWNREPEEKRPKGSMIEHVKRDNAGFQIDYKGSKISERVALNETFGGLKSEGFWDPYISNQCKAIFLTRTGSRASQPNKCVAVARVPAGYESPLQHSHRIGFTARLTNQYQADYSRRDTLGEESDLLPPFLTHLDALEAEFKKKVGNPFGSDNSRRSIIVMVANDGVYDLLLNFICSIEKLPTINKRDIVVFVGTKAFAGVVEKMGVHAIHSTALGSMPENAANNYLDKTFSRMMWFKTTSVFLAVKCGFNVLFQDVDLVWLADPMPHLMAIDADISFMDDGARSPRYTPFFVNSGFYFVKHNARTRYFEEKMVKAGPSEIGYTHSHQSVLIRHLSESYHHAKLSVYLLDRELFPSGQAYHENKPFIKKIMQGLFTPYVFHMCWTSNRVDKVRYFKEIGLWYLPEEGKERLCSNKRFASSWHVRSSSKSITSLCCRK